MKITFERVTTESFNIDLNKLPYFNNNPRIFADIMRMYYNADWNNSFIGKNNFDDESYIIDRVQDRFYEPVEYRDENGTDYEIYQAIGKCNSVVELARTLLSYNLNISWFINDIEDTGFYIISEEEFFDRLKEYVYLSYKNKLDRNLPGIEITDTNVEIKLNDSDSFDY